MPADENVVRSTIEAQGRRLDWVAAQMGISQSYLTLLLKGKRRWSARLRVRIATVLGVPEDVLFFHSDCRQTDDGLSAQDMKGVAV